MAVTGSKPPDARADPPREDDARPFGLNGSPRTIALEISRRYGVIIVWGIIIAVFGALRPDTFLTTSHFRTIFGSQAVLVIITLGLLIPFAAGEFDLSIAGVMSVSLVLTGYLNVLHGWPIVPVILVVLLVALAVGAINAFFVVRLDVDSIIVTLGTGTALVGAGFGISDLTTAPISNTLVSLVRTQFLGLPLVFYYVLGLTTAMWYVFAFTPLGRYLYFVGAGRDVARLAGLPVNAIRTGALVASPIFAALAGVAEAGYLGASDANTGATFLLPTFAAAFLGAATVNPGRFNPWGSFVAVYFLVTGITGLELLGLSDWITQVFYGVSLVLAVTFSRLAARRQTE
jgi:ribose transport system permease protein